VKKALEYAERGWHVFPVPPDTKASFKSEKDYGTKWGMTKDPDQIKRDWRTWPNAGVGIPTGKVNGFFVVEADTKKGHGVDGIKSLRESEETKGKLPQTLMAVSPSGSMHHYFKHPDGEIKIKTDSNVLPGVDVRGDGGMVVAPPTRRDNGQYRWLNEHDIADAPPWLLDLVRDRRGEQTGGSGPQPPAGDGPQPSFAVNMRTIKEINDAAMKRFAAWVPVLFPAAVERDDGWRITSAALGRNLEEDISITFNGIVDFGLHDMGDPQRGRRTPIDLVRAWRHPDLGQAAEWLRQRLGIEVGGNSSVLPAAHHHGEPSANRVTRWAIKSLLPETGMGLLSGQWGTGKTFVALDIAGSVMLKTLEFFIDYRIKRHGGVLFIAAEGVSSIGLRFEAMLAKKLGHSVLDQSPPHPFAWVNFQPQLLKQGASSLIAIAKRESEWMRETHGVDLALIIVDTVAAAAAFDREDDAAQAQTVMGALGSLSAESGAFVLGVDHFGKDIETGTRGSSAKEAYAETVLALVGKREVTGRIADLRMGVRKVRDGDQGRIIPFRLEVIDCGVDEDGDQITTCVVHWEPNRQVNAAGGRPRNHSMMISALSRANKMTISHEGHLVLASRVDHVRDEFKSLLRESQATDLTDNAIKKRWQHARASALEDRVVRSVTFEGHDYLWEIDEEFM
jgi:hypothetical protein